MPPHPYIGVEGAGGLPSKALGALVKGGGWKSLISFPTDRYPPFLGILILSLRDVILFLLRGDLGEPRPGCGAFPHYPRSCGSPIQVGPTPDHSEAPRDVPDPIRDSEQPSDFPLLISQLP